MTLWFVFVIMAAAAACLVALPFLRARAAVAAPTDAAERLKAELAQVDLDQAVGEIDPAAADAARLEAQRRGLAAAAPAEPAPVPSARVDRVTAAVVVGSVVLGAVALYGVMGKPNAPSAAAGGAGGEAPVPTAMAATQPAAGASSPGLPDVDTMIARLEDRLKAQPKDAEGWRMLGWSNFATQKYPQAVSAYAKAVALNPKSAAFQSAYGEALNKAAGGQMTPDAKSAFDTALKLDPTDARARAYLGLAPAPEVAAAPSPDTPATAPATAGGGDQQAMINGMVERQARELAANPRDAEGWVRLIRSRKVLGQPDLAHKALKDALTAFRDDAVTQKRLRDAARDLGVS